MNDPSPSSTSAAYTAATAPETAPAPAQQLPVQSLNEGPLQALQPPAPQQPPPASRRPKRIQRCRFFGSKKGCRAGAACPFAHVVDQPQGSRSHAAKEEPAAMVKKEEVSQPSTVAANVPDESRDGTVSGTMEQAPESPRVVQRPIPKQQIQNPREFQISQITKRYSARKESTTADGDSLHFNMHPSDPDFPFEIDALKCALTVPFSFPKCAPELRVLNKEMERGFQLNVERGFDTIWAQMMQPTLLRAMNALDRRLEEFLSAKKADTIKIVPNAKPEPSNTKPESATVRSDSHTVSDSHVIQPQGPQAPSLARKAEAEARRRAETQVLQNRLGRHPLFSHSSDGTIFTLPVEPRKSKDLPAELQAVKSVRLLVPKLYDIDACEVELLGVSGDTAKAVEKTFAQRGRDHPEVPLLAQINYLAQNMHIMATRTPEPVFHTPTSPLTEKQPTTLQNLASYEEVDPDRSHIRVIPRPPEWSAGPDEDPASSDDSGYSTTSESATDDEDGDDADNPPDASSNNATDSREKGIMLSFPALSLYGIELLELTILSLSIKCERCKHPADMCNIRPSSTSDPSAGARYAPCKKCSTPLGVAYRADLMHANSSRAGYLDLDACTPVDLLPSTFVPTCATCSTPHQPAAAHGQPAGVVAVRAESALAICRTCHAKLSFRFPEVKFLRVGTPAATGAAKRALQHLPRKPPKDQLGLIAGTPLPRRGRCVHYAKSYRWFRFSCCAGVYPCDKCHDAAVDHANEWATRMICGLCSREQNYRPEDCGICHALLTGKAGTGFWEGGKGTRDKARMSRKDPRKYKRRGGGALAKAAKAKA